MEDLFKRAGMKQVILLSYPRSGNTWCRYIIEEMFNIRTIGYDWDTIPLKSLLKINEYPYGVSYRNDICVIKKHGEVTGFVGNEPLIFIQRDMDSAIKRQTKEPNRFYEIEKERYLSNIFEYENWKGDKIIIDYDNLTGDVLKVIHQLADVFKLYPSHEAKESFIRNIKIHVENSIKIYCDIQKNRSFTYNKNT